MASTISSTEILGARLLREIGNEEGTLEELLKDLRSAHSPNSSRTGIPELDRLWRSNSGKLSITGRGLPLLYHVIDHMVTALNGTVALIDLDGRFSPSHLSCDLQHVHIFRPLKDNLKATLDGVEEYMLWEDHASKGREWVGTLVNGGVGGDVMVGWRGWLRVEREEVGGFAVGVSVEEVIGKREERQELVESKGWKGVSEMGEYRWNE